jgi:riboflavin kinase/FMN adenylyltransferase
MSTAMDQPDRLASDPREQSVQAPAVFTSPSAKGVASRQPLLTVEGLAGWLHHLGEPEPQEPSVVTIGHFDGVHRGHRALIGTALDQRDSNHTRVGVVTFDRHPLSLLAPAREPKALTVLEDKVSHLLGCGVDFIAVLTLSKALLRRQPEQFVDEFLLGGLGARTVVVGPNFRFGHKAAGDTVRLGELGNDRGFEVRLPELTRRDDEVVSSTRIRAAIASGRVVDAAGLLGRPHAVRGVVAGSSGRRVVVSVPGNVALPTTGTLTGFLTSGLRADVQFGEVSLKVAGQQLLAVLESTEGGPADGEEVLVHLTQELSGR